MTNARGAYRAGTAVAVLAAVLIVWTSIVHDDGGAMPFFMVVLAAAVGAVAAWFRPAGTARAMAGVAVMQALLAVGIATAPVVARVPGGSLHALAYGGFFAAMWLAAAGLFGMAARMPSEQISD